MTRKDYELLSAAIREQWDITVLKHGKGTRSLYVHLTAKRIADALAKQNKAFDPDRFMRDCGVEELCPVCNKPMTANCNGANCDIYQLPNHNETMNNLDKLTIKEKK